MEKVWYIQVWYGVSILYPDKLEISSYLNILNYKIDVFFHHVFRENGTQG